jgi:hypothetical protein
MSGLLVLGTVLVVSVIVYQLYVSRRVVRAPGYTDRQHRVQLLMIWCVPVVGAFLCHLMLSESAEVTTGDSIDSSDSDGYDGGHGSGNGDGGSVH